MDFASLILFLVLYYIRPQEWIGWVAAFKPITIVMAMAIVAMLIRYRGFRVRDFFKTPHDWLMLAYFIWIVAASPAIVDTLGKVYTLFFFYMVTVQALTRIERIQTFLNWWTAMILLLAALAVGSEHGFDPMRSYALTHGEMQGRLALNTYLFNNPNALGHSVYPVILMIYFMLFWGQPAFIRIFSIPIFCVPLYCVYLTASKGAFVAGFASVVWTLIFGRPRVVQFLVLITAVTVGWAAVKTLPRMSEMDRAQRDEAIQGRIAAFDYGLKLMRQHPTGIGYENFFSSFFKAHHYTKSTHSNYVQVGAELGYPGLFLYLAILYCCLRTLFAARTTDTREERVRRVLFVLLVTYAFSGWMVNFTYRATFFLLTGAIAAFHRHLLGKNQGQVELAAGFQPDTESVPATVFKPLDPAFQPATEVNAMAVSVCVAPSQAVAASTLPLDLADVGSESEPVGIDWERLNWMDWLLIGILTYATIWFWGYIMHRL